MAVVRTIRGMRIVRRCVHVTNRISHTPNQDPRTSVLKSIHRESEGRSQPAADVGIHCILHLRREKQ